MWEKIRDRSLGKAVHSTSAHITYFLCQASLKAAEMQITEASSDEVDMLPSSVPFSGLSCHDVSGSYCETARQKLRSFRGKTAEQPFHRYDTKDG